MGRKKIKIQPIKEDRNRSVTYLKRKAGLFKKAHELAVLTDSQVAVIVFGHNGKLSEFCSTDIDLLLLRYTEHDGVSERKGPQHYQGLDRDSDDDEDDADGDGDDDADPPSNAKREPDDHDDNDSASGSAGRNGGGGGHKRSRNGSSNGQRGGGGIKRKAEPASPSTSSRQTQGNALTLGANGAADAATQSNRWNIQAALRQSAAGPPSTSSQQQWQSPMHPTAQRHAGRLLPAVNPMRASMIANMSIAMPPSADRVPIFVMPATPGITPGGTVTTPGGRRSSFSDVMLRNHVAHSISRPVSANALLTPSFLNMQDQYGTSATPAFDFHSAQAMSGQDLSNVMASGSTDFVRTQRLNSGGYSVGGQTGGPTQDRMARPYTASGDFAHVQDQVSMSSYPSNGHQQQNLSGNQLLSSAHARYGFAPDRSDADRSRGLTLSATPVPSHASSSTPDFGGNSSSATGSGSAAPKLKSTDSYAQPSLSSSNISTDDDSPMDNTQFSQHYLDPANDMPNSFQQWFEDHLSAQKPPQSTSLVQPIPVYAEHHPFNGS